MPFSDEYIAEINAETSRRIFIAETKGGITLIDALSGTKEVPPNYIFDSYTQCYIPPDLDLAFEAAKLRAN